MAREKHIALQPGRRQRTTFDVTISPLGSDVGQTPSYSPSREVGTRQERFQDIEHGVRFLRECLASA